MMPLIQSLWTFLVRGGIIMIPLVICSILAVVLIMERIWFLRRRKIFPREKLIDRLVAEGRLEHHRVKDEWERWQRIARAFGYAFFSIGVVLLLLIIYAMVSHLSH